MKKRVENSGKRIGNVEHHSVPTSLKRAKTFLQDEYLKEIEAADDQDYFYFKCKCYHSSKKHEAPHAVQVALVINSHAYLLCNQSRHAFRFVCTKRAHDNNCRISNLVCILGACDLTRKVLFCTISEWNKSEFIRKQLRLLRVYNMAPNVGLEITT